MPLVETEVAEKIEARVQALKDAISKEEILIFDANACTQSAHGYIGSNIKRFRTNAAKSEIAEKLIAQIFSYIEEKYLLLMHQYFIRVASKYLHLLRAVKEVNDLPEVQKKLSPGLRVKETKRLELLQRELDEFEALKTKLTVNLLRWKENVEEKHFPGFKTETQYKQMADKLEQQLGEHKEDMERFGKLLVKQNSARFEKLIKMAEALLKLVAV